MSIKVDTNLRIMAADDGGFIVSRGGYRDGVFSSPAFAGPLGDCLDYMRVKLAPPEPAAQTCACQSMKPGEWRAA
jgi:hypothetical protein